MLILSHPRSEQESLSGSVVVVGDRKSTISVSYNQNKYIVFELFFKVGLPNRCRDDNPLEFGFHRRNGLIGCIVY